MLTPVRPMQASIASSLPSGEGWSYEVKWDGYRALLVNDASRPRLISRNLKNLTADYAHIAAAAPRVSPQPLILDGEIVALDDRGRPSFQARGTNLISAHSFVLAQRAIRLLQHAPRSNGASHKATSIG